MPKQQQFEGPILEDILEMIHETYGADIEIASADKVRKGGVGGFFSKEMYQVTIEVPDDARRPAASVLDLVDRVHDEAPVGARARGGVAVFDDRPVVVDDERHDRASATASTPGDAGRGPGALAGHSDDDSFVDLRQAIRSQRRREADDRQSMTAEDFAVVTPDAHRLSTEGSGFAAVLAQISEQARRDEDAVADEPTVDDVVDPVDATDDLVMSPGPARRFRGNGAPAVPTRTPQRTTRAPLAHSFDTADLVRLGLPPQFLRKQLAAGDQLGALLELAALFPVAPPIPRTGDAVIALVGDRKGMLEVANHLNEELGLNPDRLMVASRRDTDKLPMHRRIDSIEAAESQRRTWKRKSQPMLVVIDEPVTRVRTSWSRHVLEALEATSILGVVEAQRKPEDIIDWTGRIGGVDSLAVCGTDETSSPASVLTTGIPVSLIDGRPATAARWAAVLDERLYAA